MYICTEDVFPSKRLRQLTEFFVQDHSNLKLTAKNVSDNIFVEHVATIVSNVCIYVYDEVYQCSTELS